MLTQRQKDDLIRLTREFDENYSTPEKRAKFHSFDPEQDLYMILQPLFEHDGYILDAVMSERHGNVDYLAIKRDSHELIGVEVKPDARRANMGVRQLVHASKTHQFERAILVSLSGFSKTSQINARQYSPIDIQLLDINGIKSWVSRIEVEEAFERLNVEDIIKFVSKTFIEKIVENPDSLMKLEWRDIERTIAEVFEGLSFTVTLTPPSGDGGKDIILQCSNKGTNESYIVEIKHWRSLQKVGNETVKEFLSVICREKRKSGLFLSTYGFTNNAFEGLTEIQRKLVRFGEKEKIVSLCKSYLKVKSGIWSPMNDLGSLITGATT